MAKITGRARYRDDDDPEAIHHVTSEFEVTPEGAAFRVGNQHGQVHPKDVMTTTDPLERRVVQRFVTAVQVANYRNSPPRPVPKGGGIVSGKAVGSTVATHKVCQHCGGMGMLEGRDGCWSECLVCQRAEEEMGTDDL